MKTDIKVAQQIPTGMIDQQMLPVSRDETQQAIAQIPHTEQITNALQIIDTKTSDIISDRVAHKIAHRAVPTKNTLPAIINKQLRTVQNVEPQWHMIKHLPGYLKSGIRALGRQVFSIFTTTPIEEIQMIACFNGSNKPNELREINAVAGFMQLHGQHDPIMEMDFCKSIEGYKAEAKVYHYQQYTFVLVEDFAGKYIYSWPKTELLIE